MSGWAAGTASRTSAAASPISFRGTSSKSLAWAATRTAICSGTDRGEKRGWRRSSRRRRPCSSRERVSSSRRVPKRANDSSSSYCEWASRSSEATRRYAGRCVLPPTRETDRFFESLPDRGAPLVDGLDDRTVEELREQKEENREVEQLSNDGEPIDPHRVIPPGRRQSRKDWRKSGSSRRRSSRSPSIRPSPVPRRGCA